MPPACPPSVATPSANPLQRRGMMVVLASPPGGGKTSVSRAVMARDPLTTISVSATTRAMRPGEVEGTHYYFMDRPAFEDLINKVSICVFVMSISTNLDLTNLDLQNINI